MSNLKKLKNKKCPECGKHISTGYKHGTSNYTRYGGRVYHDECRIIWKRERLRRYYRAHKEKIITRQKKRQQEQKELRHAKKFNKQFISMRFEAKPILPIIMYWKNIEKRKIKTILHAENFGVCRSGSQHIAT